MRLPNAIGLNQPQPRFRADDVFRADPRGRQDALAAVSRLPEPQQHPLRGWLNATAPKKSR